MEWGEIRFEVPMLTVRRPCRGGVEFFEGGSVRGWYPRLISASPPGSEGVKNQPRELRDVLRGREELEINPEN